MIIVAGCSDRYDFVQLTTFKKKSDFSFPYVELVENNDSIDLGINFSSNISIRKKLCKLSADSFYEETFLQGDTSVYPQYDYYTVDSIITFTIDPWTEKLSSIILLTLKSDTINLHGFDFEDNKIPLRRFSRFSEASKYAFRIARLKTVYQSYIKLPDGKFVFEFKYGDKKYKTIYSRKDVSVIWFYYFLGNFKEIYSDVPKGDL